MIGAETRYVFLWLFFLYVGVHEYRRHPLGGIHFVGELPKRLCGLENAYIDVGVSSKWMKVQFWVNFPFKKTSLLVAFAELAAQIYAVL